mgnify:CR=1 FL=1
MHSEFEYRQILSTLTRSSHRSHGEDSLVFFQFLHHCLSDSAASESLIGIISTDKNKKVSFIALVCACLLSKSEPALYQVFCQRFGQQYLATLESHLAIMRSHFISPRPQPAMAPVADNKAFFLNNIKFHLEQLNQSEAKQRALSDFLQRCFRIRFRNQPSQPMRIAILVDDLAPSFTATLTKLVFDQIAVLMEYTPHHVYLLSGRLQTPDDTFWAPPVHQTKKRPLKQYLSHYQIPRRYHHRISLIYLNQYFYKRRLRRKLPVDVFATYPFRHHTLEPSLYRHAPVVECEIMSGMSKIQYCDIIVPSGIPDKAWLAQHYSRVVLVPHARRPFHGIQTGEQDYIKGKSRFIVSAAKDFDKRLTCPLEDFLSAISNFLLQHEDMSWVFVGSSSEFEGYLQEHYPSLLSGRRIITVSFEPDLPALFKQAYLFVQPPLVGGGKMPAIAIENDCPALSYNFGDCTRYLPVDCQFDSHQKLMECVDGICGSTSEHDKLLAVCKQILTPSINAESAFSYEAALKRGRAKFLARQTNKKGRMTV